MCLLLMMLVLENEGKVQTESTELDNSVECLRYYSPSLCSHVRLRISRKRRQTKRKKRICLCPLAMTGCVGVPESQRVSLIPEFGFDNLN